MRSADDGQRLRSSGDRLIARILSLQLNPNASAAFVELFEETVLPALREEEYRRASVLDLGGAMFACLVSLQVKPNASSDFTRVFEKIIPALHQQRGFAGELLFVEPGGPEMVAISLWKSRADAEAHERGSYPELLSALAELIERPPAVKTLQLAYSTLHPPGAAEFPNQSPNTTPPGSPGA